MNNFKDKSLVREITDICCYFARCEDKPALLNLDRVLGLFLGYLQELPPNKQVMFQQLIMQALQGMQDKNYVYLADVLEYGIVPLMAEQV
jgi:hypothetical protein